MKNKKRRPKIINIPRGPLKLKPTQAHRSKRICSRKREKAKLKPLVKTVLK